MRGDRAAELSAPVDREHAAYAGQRAYTPSVLAVYDAIVFGFNSPVLWRCRKSRLLESYDANVSGRHLDIGVGTGLLMDQCRFPVPVPEITLMDLNPNSLSSAARRLRRYSPRTHRANVLEPWGLGPERFDSVAMTYLLHCLPGAIPQKAAVFEHGSAAIAPGGVLFGATVLGKGVEHTRRSRQAIRLANRGGVLSNLDDDLEDLDAALGRVFPSHEIEIEGTVALFVAHRR